MAKFLCGNCNNLFDESLDCCPLCGCHYSECQLIREVKPQTSTSDQSGNAPSVKSEQKSQAQDEQTQQTPTNSFQHETQDNAVITCADCGYAFDSNLDACPECGCPISECIHFRKDDNSEPDEATEEETNEVSVAETSLYGYDDKPQNRKKRLIAIIICGLLILGGGIGFLVWWENGRPLRELKESAEEGDAYYQTELAIKYYKGIGVEQNYTEAAHWFRKAAEQGYAYAQFDLGNCYANGEGVTQDLKEAANWYKKSADQGNKEAQYNLGNCYANGEGVAQDLKEAILWYRKSAEQGLAEAQYNLGVCYENGMGVKKDFDEAIKWYEKSAENGYSQGAEAAEKAKIAKQEAALESLENARRAMEWFSDFNRTYPLF